MSTGEPAGEGGGGGGESTPGGDHSAGTPAGVTGIQSGVQTGPQHPPPSPLSGCYLLVVLPEPHTAQHKDLIINRLAKGFLSWDKDSCHVDLEKELQALVAQAPEGEEARNGERLIQYATENLVTEVLIHPQTNTLLQCIRNLLASFTKHRHIIHAGYTFSGNGSWILQDGTFSLADFLDAFSEHEVQRVLRAYENSVTVDIHCTGVGDWTSSRLSKEACTRSCRVRVNPDDVLTAGVPAISSFTSYVGQYLIAQTLDQLMEPSDVVGNIRFSHPTLYVFPGGQGDAALFGINGFNMLVDGGFARKACFWDFARHLDRLDAVLLTRVNNSNIGGMSSVLRKKQEMHVYPQIGHFFCNLVERRQANSPDGDKDVDPLILNLTDLGQEMMVNLRHINLRAHPCYRDLDPINLYHKVGHGTLDMYVLSPSKDTREVREFLTKWQASDSKLFAGSHKKDSSNLTFPIQNLVSICALLVWQPANPEDTITRILFPGSTPQNKIFEGLERLKHLEFMKHPVCSAKSLSPSTSLVALKEKTYKQKASIIEKSMDKDKDIKRVSDYRKEKKETLDQKTVKGVEESTPKPSVPSAPIIPTKQPAKVDVKAKKVVENKKIIDKETKTESKKIERELKEVKKDHVIRKEAAKAEKQEIETKKTDVVKTETEKTVITKESKPKPEPKRKEIKETRTVVKSKVEATAKPAPKPAVAEKKLKPSIDKKDVKSSPTTPKKIVNGTASRTEITKASSAKTTVKTTSRTVSAVPGKSAKDANNRKVVESKNIALSSTPAAAAAAAAATAAKAPSVTAKPKSTDRKPISRRPKTGSPSKPRLPGSPAKSTRSTPTASVKSEKDGVIRRPKSDKGTTDSSAVSTPSAIEVESVVKMVDKSLTEKSDDISIDSIESKALADLKEEREVVEEIEAVLSKAERNEIARKDDQAEGDDEITAEATDKKDEDVTEEDITAEIEDAPKKVGSRKESQEFTEEDEYLIVEKEEIYTEDSALSGEGEQKHLLDEVESEKVKKYEISKDLDVPEEEEEEAKEKDATEEKEKDEKPEKKIQFDETPEDEEKKTGGLSPTGKERLQEEVKDIISSATEIVQKTEERDDSGKKDSEDITKEPSSVSPDKFDSSEKKTTDTDLKPEADQKEQIPEKFEESQDRISTLESGATTTAPTLPEDERITLDEIKEDVDEKYVKEEVKEKEIEPVKEKPQQETPPPVPSTTMKSFVIRETVPPMQRDIVKTPDEVADLPVHEEVDPKLYDMDDFDKVKEDKVPQTPEAKEPPTPPVKEQKGMFSFFGKVADKFEKGMDKLTGKSRKDTDKESEEKSSKSSSPKEAKPQEKTNLGEIDMGKVFAKVGKIEPHDTFEKAKAQSPIDIKVAAIKETAAFLQQEIRETRIDTVHPVEPVIPADPKRVEVPLEPKKEPVLEDMIIPKGDAPKLEATIDALKEKASELIPSKEEIVSEDLVEDTREVEALLEEASKKFVTVKDSLRDSLESLEDKIAEEIIEDIQPTKDPVKSTLVGVAERLEEFRPQDEDTADSKEPEKVKFEIPKDSEDAEDDSEEYVGPVRDLKEAVRDVGEVLAGTAGIVIDDKPKDVIEIVKKVAEVLKDDNFLSEKVLFDKPDQKDVIHEISRKPIGADSADSGATGPKDITDVKPIIEGTIMPKKVGVTEELPPQEEIDEMLEVGLARPLSAYERPDGLEVREEPCIKIVKDPIPDVQTSPGDRAPLGNDVKDMCSAMMKDRKTPSPRESPKEEYKGKIDVMEAGIEEVCTKKQAKRDSAGTVEDEIADMDKLEQPEIHFEQKLSPAQAELVMVTPDSAPTSPKFTSDKVYGKELEDAPNDESKVPGVSKEIEEFISSKADVYDIIDEVIRKGKKITIEIIEYIVIVKKVSREHVIYIIEEIIINKGIPPDSVVENVDILRSQDSTNELIISSIKRVEIEEYIITEYIMKGKRITVRTIEEIAIKKVVPKRIIIEIIEEIIIKRKMSRESVYEMVEEEFIKQVKPIYDEYDRQLHRAKPETGDHEAKPAVEEEKPETTDDKLSPKPEVTDVIPAQVQESLREDDRPKVPGDTGSQQAPESAKEKNAPIFDEKDLDEGKLIDDFVNISSKDAVLNFLQEEMKSFHEEYVGEKKDSPDVSRAAADDAMKDSGDDFEAVEQEYKLLDNQKTTATTLHEAADSKDKDDVLEAVEDGLDDVVEAAEKFVEETREKPEDLKESPITDALTDKLPREDSAPIKAKTQSVPEVTDDAVQSRTRDEAPAAEQSKPDDASDGADDESISHAPSVIASEVLNATEKYLVEDKEKTTIVAEKLPKLSTETKQVIDDITDAVEDITSELGKDEPQHEQKPLAKDDKIGSPPRDIKDSIKDTTDEILDVERPTEKLDKSEPKTDAVRKDDHPKETTTDEQDDGPDREPEKPELGDKAHVTDVKTTSIPEEKTISDKIYQPEKQVEGEDVQKIEEPKLDTDKKDVKEVVAKTPDTVAPVIEKTEKLDTEPEQGDNKPSEPAEIQKSPSQESVKDVTRSPDVGKDVIDVVKDKTDELKGKGIVPDVSSVKILETSEIVDFKGSASELDEEKEITRSEKIPEDKTSASPDHTSEIQIVDSSCFNIDHSPTPEALKKVVLDTHDTLTDEPSKPELADIETKDRESDKLDEETDHIIRKKRSLGEDSVEPETTEPEIIDSKPTETAEKVVDSAAPAKEKEKGRPEEFQKVPKVLPGVEQEIEKLEESPEDSTKPDDDEEDKEVGTVRRMVVTASSEDGGHETELCPTGSITFGKPVTPDDSLKDSLKDISTKSTPDKDSLQMEKDSLYSGKSTPEKDSISEKSISELKDDKVTPEDSLERSIHGHVTTTDEGSKKSHAAEPEEKMPVTSDDVVCKLPQETEQQIDDDETSSPADKTSEKPTEDILKKPVETVPEKVTDKVSAKLADEVPAKPAGQVPEKPSTDSGTGAETIPEKITDKISEKQSEEDPEKLTGKLPGQPVEEVPEKPAEIPGLKSPEPSESEELSLAESVFDKSPSGKLPSENLVQKLVKDEPEPDDETGAPSIPTETVDKEAYASRKPSIVPVEHDETKALDDKLRKDKPRSPIEAPSTIPGNLDEKYPPIVAQKAKSPVPLSGETADKSRSPSITPEDLGVRDATDDKEQKDKSPSPTGEEHAETPDAPKITPGELEERHAPTEKLVKDKSPSPSPETLPDALKSVDILSLKHEGEDVPSDKLPGEKSALPIVDEGTDKPRSPSIVSAELGQEVISPDKIEKDRSPSPSLNEKAPDRSPRTPSITSERLDGKDIPEDKVHKDKSPSPTSEEKSDRPRTPSITTKKSDDKDVPEDNDKSPLSETEKTSDRPQTPEKPHGTDSLVDKIHKDRTPSPVSAKDADKSPIRSVTSEEPDVKDILESTVRKDKSPSPTTDAAPDKSQPPSTTPKKPAVQVAPDHEIQKERSPSPSTNEMTDKSRTPSSSYGRPDDKIIPEDQEQKEKSPSPTPTDGSRKSSITSEKPAEQIIPDSQVPKERSPSPSADGATDRSRAPSITSEKPDAKDILGSTGEKEKSTFPTCDEKLDESRTPSITPDKPAGQVAPDVTLHTSRSPSPTPEKVTEKPRSPSISSEKPDEKVISEIQEQKDKSPSPAPKDRSRSPSIAQEKPAEQIIPDGEVHKERSPSPATEGVTDRSRAPSITSDKPDTENIPRSTAGKDESPTRDEKLDKSGTSSITPEKPAPQDALVDKAVKDRSPSTTADKVADNSRTSEKPDGIVVRETQEQEDKSPSPTIEERSRTPSMISDKPDAEDISGSSAVKDKSPSPTADEKPDKSRSPSIISEKPSEHVVPGDMDLMDESTSPALDETTDKARKPSISSEKPDEHGLPDDKVHKDKSPSPTKDQTHDRSRSPSIVSEVLRTKEIPNDEVHKDRLPSPVADTLTEEKHGFAPGQPKDKDIHDNEVHEEIFSSPITEKDTPESRKPSIISEKPDEKHALHEIIGRDRTPSPMTDNETEKSREPSTATEEVTQKNILDDKKLKDRSPSPISDVITKGTQKPSTTLESPDHKNVLDDKVLQEKSPSPIVSRKPSIMSDKPDGKTISDGDIHQDRSPSPSTDKVTGKSRSPSIASEKPDEKIIPDDGIHKDRSPSPSTDKVTGKSRSPSIASEKPDEKTIPDDVIHKDRSPSPITDKGTGKSRSPSIASEKPDEKTIPDDVIHKDRSPSPSTDKVTGKSRSPSIASEKPDEKIIPDDGIHKDRSPSPIMDKITGKSRSPSIASEKPDEKTIPDDVIHKDRSPSPITDKGTGKSRSPSIASEKPDEKTIPDDGIHQDRSPSPSTDKVTGKSRSPSIASEKPDEKTIPDDGIHKDRSPSPSTDKVTGKSRSPGIALEKPDEKDILECEIQKDKSPSPTTDDKTERHSRASSISSEKLDHKDVPDDKTHKEKSPSPTEDKISDKPRSPSISSAKPDDKDVTESPTQKDKPTSPSVDEKPELHSRTPSVSSEKPDDDDIPAALRICVYPYARIHQDRTSSPTTDEKIVEPQSPGITSGMPDGKDIPEFKAQKDKSPSPTTSDKTDRLSRTSSTGSMKQDGIDSIVHVPKEKSPSPVPGTENDKSRSPSIVSEIPDGKDISDIKLRKDRSPSPTGDKITDKPDQKVLAGEVPKDRSISPTTDKVTDRSRTPSISSEKLGAPILPADKLPKYQSPSSPQEDEQPRQEETSVISDKLDKPVDKSRSPSIISEKLDDKDISSEEHQKEKSPSTTTDQITDWNKFPSVPDHKLVGKDLPKEGGTEDEKLDDKPDICETPKKLSVSEAPDVAAFKKGASSPCSDISDKISSPSTPALMTDEKDTPQSPGSASDKLDDKKPHQTSEEDESPSASGVEVGDKSRSPSIASDKSNVKEPSEKPKSPGILDDKPAQLGISPKDGHEPDDKIEIPDKSKSPIASPGSDKLTDTPISELSDNLKAPGSIEDESNVSDQPMLGDHKPQVPEDDKPEDLSRPSSAISSKPEGSTPQDPEKNSVLKSPSLLSEEPEEHPDTTSPVDKLKTLDIKPSDSVDEPKSQSPSREKTDKTESKSPSPSTDVLSDQSRSPSIVSERPDDLIRPSSRASTKSEPEEPAEGQKSPIPTHEVGKEKEIHTSPADSSLHEKPKSPGGENDEPDKKDTADSTSPRDRSPSYDRTPKDRSRSHSLFDTGDKTPLGRSRAASLFDDKLDDKITLLDLDAMRPSISEEIEDDRPLGKADDRRPVSKSPSVADLASPKDFKEADIADSDLPAAKRLEIEQYIIDEFILKNRKITSEIIEEIVIKKSVSRYIIIEIIEEIIIKRKITRGSVIEGHLPEEDTEVETKPTLAETPEAHDDKSPQSETTKTLSDSKRASIASETIPVHKVPEEKTPRGSISMETPDLKDSPITSTVSDQLVEPEHHVIKKRSILDGVSPEQDILDATPEPMETEPQEAVTGKDDGPEQGASEIKRPSIIDDKHPKLEPAETKPLTSASPKSPEAESSRKPSLLDEKIPEYEHPKETIDAARKPSVAEHLISELDSKKPDDRSEPNAKVIPTVVAKTEDGDDIQPKGFEDEEIIITDAKRIDIEEYIVEEYIKRNRMITRESIEEIVIRKSVPRYIIFEIIEEIIIKRKISRSSVIDFAEVATTDKEYPEPADRSTGSSMSDKDDTSKLRKFSEDKFDITTGKSTPEISSAKDQTIDFSGKSTPDLKSSLLSEKFSDKSGYSTPDLKQFDERSGKSTPDYRTEYESQFHKAFVGGITEMRTTHITTLSGKSTPDFGAGHDDAHEPESETQSKSDIPSDKLDRLRDDDGESPPPADKTVDTVSTSKDQSDPREEEVPGKPSDSETSTTATTSDQSILTKTISGVTKATSELVTKISESAESSITTVTSKILTSEPESKIITHESVSEDTKTSSTVTTVKTSEVESEPQLITKIITPEIEAHEPSETEVITKTIRHVTEIEEGEPETITKVIKRESITPEDRTTSSGTVTTITRTIEVESEPEIIMKVIKREVESHEPSEIEVITKTVKHITEVEESEPEIITKVIKRESVPSENGTTFSETITTVTKTIEAESEPEMMPKLIICGIAKHEPSHEATSPILPVTVIKTSEVEPEPETFTKVIKREIETHEPSETEIITRTVRHVTEIEEGEPEIIKKVIKREIIDPEDDTTSSRTFTTVTTTSETESEPEIITKTIRREIEMHDPSETEVITRTIRHITEIEEGEPEITRKVIKREIVDPEDGTSTSSRTFTTVTTSETESEPEIITKTIRREIEMHEPSETEVITRTIRHVTEFEESEPETITKVIRREIILPDDNDEEEVSITKKIYKVLEQDDSEHTVKIAETSKTVTESSKSTEAPPDVVKRIISREGAPEVTETITTRTTRTIVSEAIPSTGTATKTTTTTISSDIEKPELVTRIISREGTPEISETIKRTTKTISSDAGPEYITKIISREGTPDILKSSEVKRIVTTVTTVTGPDGECVTTKDVKESSDKLDGEDLLEKLIDSSSSDKNVKSTPEVKTSEERFVSETPDGLITEEIIKRTVTTVTSSSGTSTPDVKTFIDSGKTTPDHKDDVKSQIPTKDHATEKAGKAIPETVEDTSGKMTTEKITGERSTPEIPTSGLVKGIISEDKSYSGKSSPDISMPKDVASSGTTGKSTPEIPISPLIRDSASIPGRILSGRSTPDRKSDGKSRTATPDGFRSGEVIRTIITTTRTMSDDGEIITVTKEVTESTDEQGQTVILEEKTNVKRDDSLPSRDAAETAISGVIGSIKACELKRGSSPGSDVMSDKDAGPLSPRSDISSGHSRAATHVWGSSEERQTYSDDEPPSSPLSASSQFGYSPQQRRYELPLDKDSHKTGDIASATMTGSFYGELPTDPAAVKSSSKSSHTSSSTTSKYSDPIPIQGEQSATKRFTVEKEFAGGYEYKMESKKYVDDGDLDFDRAMMEHREKRGEDLVPHHYSNGSSLVVHTNGNSKETITTRTTSETKIGDKKKSDPVAASFSAETETEEAGKSGKDPLEGWGKPLFLPSPRPPRKFNLQRPVASTSSEELSPESLNFDVINNWGEPLRLPSPAPAPTIEVSNKGSPGTPKKERKQPKKVISENNKNKKRSESPSKNDKKTKDSKNKVQPVYMDLTYVPHHGNSYYSSLEFFKRIRARYYVFSGTEPSREVYDALLEAKKTWEDKNLEVTMIPTYDTDTLGYWVADNEEALAANHIDLSPSASRCTINLQDHETSCSAYRLEF